MKFWLLIYIRQHINLEIMLSEDIISEDAMEGVSAFIVIGKARQEIHSINL